MADFPFQIVGFDLDGTLCDTHQDIGMALNHALALAKRPKVPIDEVRDLIGGGAKILLRRALALTGGEQGVDVSALHRELIAYYADHLAVHSRLFPGGAAMLDALASRGVQLAVVTNKLEALAVELLTELGLAHRFYAIIGGDTLGPGKAKPAPDLLNQMVMRGGGGRTVYIGDTTYDVLASKAAGLPCIACSFGFNDAPVAELGADAVIDHFDQLVPTLETMYA